MKFFLIFKHFLPVFSLAIVVTLILGYKNNLKGQTCRVEAPFPYSTFYEDDIVDNVAPVPMLTPASKQDKPSSEILPPREIRLVRNDESPLPRPITMSNDVEKEEIPTPAPLGARSRSSRFSFSENRTNSDDQWLNIDPPNKKEETESLFNTSETSFPSEWEMPMNPMMGGGYLGGYGGYGGYGGMDGGMNGHYGGFGGMGGYGGMTGNCSPWGNLGENVTASIGAAGFASPLDYGSGCFGFTESLNWCSPTSNPLPINVQAGFRAIQSKLCGYAIPRTNVFESEIREQYFGTVAVSHRGTHVPAQLGVAYDFMRDNYDQKIKLEQLRAELSYISPWGYEIGVRSSFGMKNDTITRTLYRLDYDQFENRWHADWFRVTQKVSPNDYYALFIKKYYANGGEGAISAGATNYGDGIFRADFTIPLTDCVSLQNSVTYIIPSEGRSFSGARKESWNLMLQLTFQPRGGLLAGFCDPFRPMFDVADNGTFLPSIR